MKKARKKSKRVKRKSKRVKKKSKIVLKKGTLPGYKLSYNQNVRRNALSSAVDRLGYVSVMRKVNVLSIFLRRKNPEFSAKAEKDKKWLMKKYK